MTAELISGTRIRKEILAERSEEVRAMKAKHGRGPGLVTILIGENPASISYVTLKVKTAEDLGFHEVQDNQPVDISEAALLALIDKYNNDPRSTGYSSNCPCPNISMRRRFSTPSIRIRTSMDFIRSMSAA